MSLHVPHSSRNSPTLETSEINPEGPLFSFLDIDERRLCGEDDMGENRDSDFQSK
jgi:hypothetical protein